MCPRRPAGGERDLYTMYDETQSQVLGSAICPEILPIFHRNATCLGGVSIVLYVRFVDIRVGL